MMNCIFFFLVWNLIEIEAVVLKATFKFFFYFVIVRVLEFVKLFCQKIFGLVNISRAAMTNLFYLFLPRMGKNPI